MPEETRELMSGSWLDHGRGGSGNVSCKSCAGELLQSHKLFCTYSRSFGTGEEEYDRYRMLFLAEVEVDIELGKIKILHIINVHDSGKLINPTTCRNAGSWRYVHGNGLWRFRAASFLDEKTGRPLNGTLA